ncbi:urea transporter [Cohnella endophytica]|uniref:Urea transporter n=1 Tax=Cohnella endophytica TaxID=2419778 RepID=A0A494XLG5_9BACL|nr:urea transporter [Cohnella endophytica]RKP51530.1 urea transporter [Cohnella endophytica]
MERGSLILLRTHKTQTVAHSFLAASLKGISQVILIENSISGLIILAAITIGNLSLGIITLLSAMIGTWIGIAGGKDRTAAYRGLFGYNSVLTGLALSLFLSGNFRWVIALAGAAITALVTAAAMHMMRNIDLPVLTLPYILFTWFLLLSTFFLERVVLSPELVPQDLTHWRFISGGAVDWFGGMVNGIGQVYFQHRLPVSILILIAVFWAGWKLGLCAILGTITALITAYGLGAEEEMLNPGLYGFNAVLTNMAVAVVFRTAKGIAWFMAIIAAMVTVPITAGLGVWLAPYGMPILTMPFVLVTWMFIAARKTLSKI